MNRIVVHPTKASKMLTSAGSGLDAELDGGVRGRDRDRAV
jgi:hypothetical protein